MATVNIQGRKVTVSDDFLKLSPEQRADTVDEIAGHIGIKATPQGNADRHSMTAEAGDVLTMGLQPKINALGGAAIDSIGDTIKGQGPGYWQNYDNRLQEQRSDQTAYEEQNPIKSRVGQAAGLAAGIAALPAVTPFKVAAGAAPAVNMLKTVGNVAATGGTYGGIAGSAQDANSTGERANNTATGAAWGAALAPLAIPASKVIGKVAGVFTKKPTQAPTIDQLRAIKSAAYDSADTGIGKVQMKPDEYLNLSRGLNKVAQDNGIGGALSELTDSLYGNSSKALQGINRIGKEIAAGNRPPPTFGELEQMRQVLRKTANASVQADGNLSPDGHMATEFIDEIDNIIGQTPYKEAREAHRTLRKSESIEDALYRADLAAGANYTAAGAETAIRHQFKRIALGKNFERTFNPDEQKAILMVVKGGKAQNFFRRFGALAPKGGLSTMFNILTTLHNPAIGIPLGMAATGAKMGASAQTARNAQFADEMVRRGGVAPPKLPNRLGELLQNPLAQIAGRAGGNLTTR